MKKIHILFLFVLICIFIVVIFYSNRQTFLWEYQLNHEVSDDFRDRDVLTFSSNIKYKSYKQYILLIKFNDDCEIYCINSKTGKELWSRTIWKETNLPFGDIKIYDNHVYFLQNIGGVALYSLNIENGKVEWSLYQSALKNDFYDPFQEFFFSNDTLYTITKRSELIKIEINSGKFQFSEKKYSNINDISNSDSFVIYNKFNGLLIDCYRGNWFVDTLNEFEEKRILISKLKIYRIKYDHSGLIIKNINSDNKKTVVSNNYSISLDNIIIKDNNLVFSDSSGVIHIFNINSYSEEIIETHSNEQVEIDTFKNYLLVDQFSLINMDNKKKHLEIPKCIKSRGELKLITEDNILIKLTKGKLRAYKYY